VSTPAVKRSQVIPPRGSRLEELQARYDDAEAQAKEAAERFEAVKNGIKTELAAMAPGALVIALAGRVPLTLSWKTSWRLDSKTLKADDPLTYVRYAKQSGYWELRRG
jgi:hypothetical protein